jgi:hypothetical protein
MTGTLDTRYLIIGDSVGYIMVSPELDRVWTPPGSEPVIGKLGKPLQSQRELAIAGVM